MRKWSPHLEYVISQQRELRWTEFLTIEAPSRTWLVHQLGHAPVLPLALGHCTGNLSVGSESNPLRREKDGSPMLE